MAIPDRKAELTTRSHSNSNGVEFGKESGITPACRQGRPQGCNREFIDQYIPPAKIVSRAKLIKTAFAAVVSIAGLETIRRNPQWFNTADQNEGVASFNSTPKEQMETGWVTGPNGVHKRNMHNSIVRESAIDTIPAGTLIDRGVKVLGNDPMYPTDRNKKTYWLFVADNFNKQGEATGGYYVYMGELRQEQIQPAGNQQNPR